MTTKKGRLSEKIGFTKKFFTMKNKSEKGKNKFITASVVIFFIMIAVIIFVCFKMYQEAFFYYNNKLCLEINAQASFVIDGDLVEHYAKTLTVDDDYKKFVTKLDNLRDKLGAEYFYILVDNGVADMYTYIYNSNNGRQFYSEVYALGRNESMSKYIGADEVLETGKGFVHVNSYEENNDKLYYSYSPIFNSRGKVVAFLGIDIIQTPFALNRYSVNIIFILLISLLLFFAIYSIIVRKTLTNPIDQITREADDLSDSLNVLKNIMNGMDAYLYVSDLETDEILYINDKMKKHFGLSNDVVGSCCWKVLQSGFTEKCSFCPSFKLLENHNELVVWEEHNSLTGRHYKNIDRVIEWTAGKKVHLQHSTDITDIKNSEYMLEKRLAQQELMTTISQSFITNDDIKIFINNALQMTGDFMNVSRILLAAYSEQEKNFKLEYAWRCEGSEIPIEIGSIRPFSKNLNFYNQFHNKNCSFIAIDNVEDNEDFSETRYIGIKALLIIPIFVSGHFWGILEFGQCNYTYKWDESDLHLAKLFGNILSGIINRQIMEKDKRRDKKKILRMSSIIDSSPQSITYINSRNGKFDLFNYATMDITGYSYDELMQGGIYILFDEQTNQLIDSQIIPSIFSRGRYSFEVPLKRKDGEVLIMSFSAFTIEGDKYGCGAIATDITEMKRLETALKEAKELAEQASKAKSEFLSKMSHEMRTPMNAIIGMTNIARGTDDKYKKEHCLERIDKASRHLLEVINDILDMSKIEANKFELYSKEFNFEKMLINVTNVITFKTEEKKQNLVVNLNKNVPLFIIGDELRLTQVITNLLTNAVKFTPEGGTIILNIEKTDGSDKKCTLQMEVIDNGIGISDEQQARLFNSFEQADGGISRKFGGTGLGLALCKRIVELMGGKIWIESKLGKGSKFIFTIEVEEGDFSACYELANDINSENIHILAVDDSAETRDYFLYVMNALGLNCEVASGAEEALYMINNCTGEPYNIFFIDWQMPDMNGIELTKIIKEFTKDKAVVIMISVAEWNDIKDEANAVGVNYFIPKPLFPSTLIDTINKCLGVSAKLPETKQKTEEYTDHIFDNHVLLLAEDIDINREIISAILENTGVAIDFAENGLEAVSKFKEYPKRYSLILMDIQMPEMDGYEASKTIRALDYEEAKNIPIIAMTANVFVEDIENCKAAGMNDHIGKPIETNELFSKLKLYLKRKKYIPKDTKSHNSAYINYDDFLPIIDVANSLNRLMNNKTMYFKLLKNFAGRQMADELIKNINTNNFTKSSQIAHALKGVASNLGFLKLTKIVSNIEAQSSAEIDSKQLISDLNEIVNETVNSINILLESEGV